MNNPVSLKVDSIFPVYIKNGFTQNIQNEYLNKTKWLPSVDESHYITSRQTR